MATRKKKYKARKPKKVCVIPGCNKRPYEYMYDGFTEVSDKCFDHDFEERTGLRDQVNINIQLERYYK